MADRAERRCAWCGRRFAVASGPGRPRRFCRRSCRQRDYEARHRARELGLSEAELIVTREELHRLFDQLWVLECAVADVERDLAAAKTVADHREALTWLLDAARPVVALNR